MKIHIDIYFHKNFRIIIVITTLMMAAKCLEEH